MPLNGMADVISTPESEELERLLELLRRHCLLGQAHFRMWRLLNRGFADTPEAGNLAPTFFSLTADGHHNSALLVLNRLIDSRRDSLSIRRFLERAIALAADVAARDGARSGHGWWEYSRIPNRIAVGCYCPLLSMDRTAARRPGVIFSDHSDPSARESSASPRHSGHA